METSFQKEEKRIMMIEQDFSKLAGGPHETSGHGRHSALRQ
jgi:hypothetical protein